MNSKNFAFVIFLFLGIFFQTQMSYSQLPKYLNYQAFLVDGTEHPLNGTYSLGFSLFTQETGGSPLWQETQSVSISKGFMNVYLGTVIPLNLDFSQEYWLEVQLGNGVYPRTRLSATPYSIRSAIAVTVDDGAITQAKLAPNVQAYPKGNAGGDLSGTYPNPKLIADSVLNKLVPGKITQNMLNPANIYNPGGYAGGDLTGTYPNPEISTAGTTGDRLATAINNGTTILSGTKVLADFGIQSVTTRGNFVGDVGYLHGLTSNTIVANSGTFSTLSVTELSVTASLVINDYGLTSNTLVANSGTFSTLFVNGIQVIPHEAAGGDLTGNFPNPTIANNSVNTFKIANLAVTDSKINDVNWNKVTSVPPAAGDLTGTYPNLTIASGTVTNVKLADLAVTDAKVNDVAWGKITGKPTFATVATSGNYNDLNNKPTTDGSETKVTSGINTTVTGSGTTGNPYVVNSARGVQAYAYLWNTGPLLLNVGDVIPFNHIDILYGITYTAGTGSIHINCSGVYAIWFKVFMTNGVNFGVIKNGSLLWGSLLTTINSNIENIGMIITSANAGDIISIGNFSGISRTVYDNSTMPNASILIQKID